MEILAQSKTSKHDKYAIFGYSQHNNNSEIYAKRGILSSPGITKQLLI